jgi:hypothetical protein
MLGDIEKFSSTDERFISLSNVTMIFVDGGTPPNVHGPTIDVPHTNRTIFNERTMRNDTTATSQMMLRNPLGTILLPQAK